MNLSANIRSSLFMLLSMLGFVVNDTFIKSLNGEIPAAQVIMIRGLFLTAFIVVIAWQRGLLRQWRTVLHVRVIFRAMCEGGATYAFLSALPLLPFANLTAILQCLPLAVTFGAALFLGEAVGWRRWAAIAIGFCGVLIIVRPGMSEFHIASVMVLVSVVFAAARDLITRQLPKALPSLLVTGMSAVFVSVLGMSVTLVSGEWHPVTSGQFSVIVFAGFFLFFGYHFIVLSMRQGEIAYVVPYRYTSLLWAILFGYLVFDEVPDKLTLIGSAIVVSMGLYSMYREVMVSRRSHRA